MDFARWIVMFVGILVLSGIHVTHADEESLQPTRIGRGNIHSVAWHPDGTYLLASTITGAWLYTPDLQDYAHIPDTQLATLSPDGRYIAGVSNQGRVQIWDANTLELQPDLIVTQFRYVHDLAWSPDGRYLAAADEDAIYAWDFLDNARTVFATRLGGDNLIWSPQGHRLAIFSSQTGSLSVFDFEDRTFVFIRNNQTLSQYGYDIAWQDENYVLLMHNGEYTEATLIDIESEDAVADYRFTIPSVAYSDGGRWLASINGIHHVIIHDTETETVTRIDAGAVSPYRFAWSPDNQWLAVGAFTPSRAGDATVLIIEPQTGNISYQLDDSHEHVEHLVWKDQLLLVIDHHQRMFLYEMSNATDAIAFNSAHTTVGDTLAWKPDGSQFALADSHSQVSFWDSTTHTQISSLDVGFPMSVIKWQPSGDLIAMQSYISSWSLYGYNTLSFQVWDTSNQQNITNRFGITGDMEFFDWHPDGDLIALLHDTDLTLYYADGGEVYLEAQSEYHLGARDIIWSGNGWFIIIPSDGYGRGGSYLYDIVNRQFLLTSAVLGVVSWSSESELVSMIWSYGGNPTPSNDVMPRLSRQSTSHFLSSLQDTTDMTLRLPGLHTHTRTGFLSPNGQFAVAIDERNAGMIWDATNGNPIAMLSDVNWVSWSPDETYLVVQRMDGSLWLLNSNGTIIRQITSSITQQIGGTIIWSPTSHQFAFLHDGVTDLWQIEPFTTTVTD